MTTAAPPLPVAPDPDLLRKYDVRGPRYTSYPTAPCFGAVRLEDLHQRWRDRNGLAEDPGLGLYLHVPFCRRRCQFCGCHTFGPRPEAEVETWLQGMEREVDLALRVVEPTRPVRQVALGGGTPSYPDPARIHRLLSMLERRFHLEAGLERSVEVDPETADPERLGVFLDHGFNRFSVGVQDFSPEVLRRSGRPRKDGVVEETVAWLRARGVQHLNLDLICGLPGQDEATAAAAAARTVALRPGRVAVYAYAHVPWLRPHQDALARRGLPGPEERAAIRGVMDQAFQAAGYVPVGMDHHALPDDPLAVAWRERTLRRTFMGYTTGRGLDILGLGPSAISQVGSSYSQNEKDLAPWTERLEAETLPVVRGFLLSLDDQIRQEVILELSCNLRVDLRDVSARFGVDVPGWLAADLARLEELAADGLVVREGDRLEITAMGRNFVRNVCMVFDRYLDGDSATQRFSRTV